MKHQAGMPEAVRLICWTCVCLIWCYGCQGQINPSTTLGCHLREYTFEVNKDMISEETGDYLYCSDKVTVYSCWGRCDSYEVQHVYSLHNMMVFLKHLSHYI